MQNILNKAGIQLSYIQKGITHTYENILIMVLPAVKLLFDISEICQ